MLNFKVIFRGYAHCRIQKILLVEQSGQLPGPKSVMQKMLKQ